MLCVLQGVWSAGECVSACVCGEGEEEGKGETGGIGPSY